MGKSSHPRAKLLDLNYWIRGISAVQRDQTALFQHFSYSI